MGKYKNLTVTNELHKRAKFLAVRLDVNIIDVVERAVSLLEAQTELPHPPDATSVPLVYQEKQSK